MPANLSADYLKAEAKYRAATTSEEKLACLEEMFTTIPKHKGTEKMQADIKTRISKLKKEMAAPAKGGAKRGGDWFHVEKQGAGQVIVFGAPNCGKSALVRELTGLHQEVAPYPFTTTAPAAGMMPFEDIQIQLVDTPPVAPEAPAWLFHILRTGDVLLWLLDLGDDALLETTEQTQSLIANARIATRPHPELAVKKTIMLGTKTDDPQAADRLAILRELIGNVPLLMVSAEHHIGLEELKRQLYDSLGILRVYTKRPGKPPDLDDPVVLKQGSTVVDAAYHLHKDFAASLQFARLWNKTGYDGQRVERGHVLTDGDVIEFHI